MCKIYTKIDSWFLKSPEVFGQLQTSTRKSKKLKFDGLLLSKNKFAQKIYCFNFQLLVWKFTKYLIIISLSTTHLLCIFLAQTTFSAETLYAIDKSST